MTWLVNTLKMPLTGAAIVAGQVLFAAHRPDMPGLPNQDPSGWFGSPTHPELRIALLGDSSITAPGVTPLDAAWPRRLAGRLAGSYHVQLMSYATGGAKAKDVLTHQLQPALDAGADLALVSVGANDALRGTPVARFEAEIAEVLEALVEITEGIGLAGVGDLGNVPRLPTLARGIGRVRARSIDRALLRAARRFPTVVKGSAWGPQWRLFAEGDPAIVFAPDRFHASAVGHACFAAAVEPVMAELLRRRVERDPRATG